MNRIVSQLDIKTFTLSGAVSWDNKLTPIQTSCFQEAIFFANVSAVSADDTININIYTLEPSVGDGFLIGSFTEITTAGNYTKIITSGLGSQIYVEIIIAGAADVACSIALSCILKS